MILYFTGTGNSRYVAKSLALYTGDQMRSLNDDMKSGEAMKYESEAPYLIVAPTYAWRMPRVVENYLKECSFQGNQKVYFFLTCGANTGNADGYLRSLAKELNLEYMGLSPIVMPDNYVIMYEPTTGEKADAMIHNAGIALKEDVYHIEEEEPFPGMSIGLKDKLISGSVNHLFYKIIVKANGFYTTEACIGCGKCEKLCPLNNIQLEKSKPVWGKDCTHCLACISACPVTAIEYKKSTKGRPRFYNTKEPENI